MSGFPAAQGSYILPLCCTGAADVAGWEDRSMQTIFPDTGTTDTMSRIYKDMSKGLEGTVFGGNQESKQSSPKELYLGQQCRMASLGEQGCSDWAQNAVLAKISNLWQQDMSCRDTLACESTIYKTGLGLGPRRRQFPNLWLPVKFQITLPKSRQAPERAVVS